jgi:murein DD-endopeptidase MepM/ murein hydrolase activator NlpD
VKKAGVWLAALAAMAGLVAPVLADSASAATSSQQRQQQIDAELRRLHGDVDEMSAQQARLLAELKVSQRARSELDAKVATLDAAIATAEAELGAVNAELSTAVAAEEAANAALTEAREGLRSATHVLRKQAIEAFMHWGQEPALEQMLRDVEDINDGPRIAAFVEAIAEKQGEVVAAQKRLRHATRQLEEEAAAARDGVAAKQQDVLARKNALEAARAEQATARAEVAAEAANEQRLLAAVQAKKSEYLRQINQLQRESNDIAAQLRKRQSGEAVTPSGHGVLAYPVTNPVMTSPYGYRTHPIYGDRRLHTGVDFRAGTGTPVYSAGGGVVVFAGWKTGYGNTVVIDHGGSLATLYAHNSALAVSTGATVKRGQRISSAGSTGNSTGPHVHFEVRVNGSPVDPMKYL